MTVLNDAMLNYLNVLLCLTAVAITRSAVIDSLYQDVKVPEYNQYQVVSENQEKVNLKMYYEVLSPACKMFHSGAWREVIEKIGSFLDVNSYPYGFVLNEIVNGTMVKRCQHDELECYGNKLNACAIVILKNATRSELYNACMMSSKWGGPGSSNMDATKCGQAMGIDAQPIIECASGSRGAELFEYYGNETYKVWGIFAYGVPYVLINGIQFEDDDEQFFPKVCAAFTNPPPQCKT